MLSFCCIEFEISFQEYETKESGILEQLVISIIMMPNIIGRALCLGVIFGLVKMFGVLILIVMFISQVILSSLEGFVVKCKITSRMCLAIFTSFTSPCLIVKEQSKHFLVNGISGSILYIIATWTIYLIVSTYGNIFPDTSLTLECHQNVTTNSTMRCPINANTTDDCFSGFFHISKQQRFTICPEDQWYLLWIISWIITGFMIVSLASVAFLHYLIDNEKRLMSFRRIGIDTCPEREASIKQYIIDIMDGKFKEVEKVAKEATGRSVLELMIQSKRIHLTKVNIYKTQINH